jgi:hypothetical protein
MYYKKNKTVPMSTETKHIDQLNIDDSEILIESLWILNKDKLLHHDRETVLIPIMAVGMGHSYRISCTPIDPKTVRFNIGYDSEEDIQCNGFKTPTLWLMCDRDFDTQIDGRKLAQNDDLLKTWTRNECAHNGSQITQRSLLKTINFLVENSMFGAEHLFNIGKDEYYLLETAVRNVFVRVHSKRPTNFQLYKRVDYSVPIQHRGSVPPRMVPNSIHKLQCSAWLRTKTTLKEHEILEAESKTKAFEFFQNAMVNLFPSKFSHNLVEPRNLRHVLLDLLECSPYDVMQRVEKSVIGKFPFVICNSLASGSEAWLHPLRTANQRSRPLTLPRFSGENTPERMGQVL